mmetsp:Transcript_47841/g.120443  ORF Transcript_47841/g.120443 Transcript_47841/m.120443 type:complete len:200 (+) Transcript_47841:495-1094(+)
MNGRFTFVDNHTVRKVSGHDKIVLHDEGGLLGVQNETLDHLGGDQTLLRIKIGARLIDEIDVSRLSECQHQSQALKLTTGQMNHLLVEQIIKHHRLEDIGLELRMGPGAADLLVEQHAYRTLELGVDGLRLVAHVELGDLHHAIGWHQTGQHADEGGLAGTVLAQHHNDLTVRERARLHLEGEPVAELLGHGRVLVLGV